MPRTQKKMPRTQKIKNIFWLFERGERWKKFFTLKYTGDQPDFVFEITNDAIGLTEYSHDEILEILKGDNWKIQD